MKDNTNIVKNKFPLTVFYSFSAEKAGNPKHKSKTEGRIENSLMPQRKDGQKEDLEVGIFAFSKNVPFSEKEDYIISEMAKKSYTPAICDELIAFVTKYPELCEKPKKIVAWGLSFDFLNSGGDIVMYFGPSHLSSIQSTINFGVIELGFSDVYFIGVRAYKKIKR